MQEIDFTGFTFNFDISGRSFENCVFDNCIFGVVNTVKTLFFTKEEIDRLKKYIDQ